MSADHHSEEQNATLMTDPLTEAVLEEVQKRSRPPKLLRCQCLLHRSHVQNQKYVCPSQARNARKLMMTEDAKMKKRTGAAVVERIVHSEALC